MGVPQRHPEKVQRCPAEQHQRLILLRRLRGIQALLRCGLEDPEHDDARGEDLRLLPDQRGRDRRYPPVVTLGFALYYKVAVCRDPALEARLLAHVGDQRWGLTRRREDRWMASFYPRRKQRFARISLN